MSVTSISEITFTLGTIGIGIVVLTALLAVIRLASHILRRLARSQVARTDLDLIGVVAEVTHTIRPRRPGKIRCQTDRGELVTEATSDSTIRSGQKVLITAINHGSFRVLPHESAPQAEHGGAQGRSDS